ncbi:MAG: M56 family metallopeptidase, partial [Planctomycetales bacterium]|nr:M56 family metallopeptidase [Planctomycetales bacterium]
MRNVSQYVAEWLWQTSWQASLLIVIVFALIRLCGDRLAPRWRHLLWCVVLARLLLPTLPASPWSLYQITEIVSVRSNARDLAMRVAVSPEPKRQTISDSAQDREFNGTEKAAAAAARPKTVPVAEMPVVRPIGFKQAEVASSVAGEVVDSLLADRHDGDRNGVTNVDATRWILVAWLIGVAILLGRTLLSDVILRGRLRRSRLKPNKELLQAVASARALTKLTVRVDICVTPEAISPCVAGWRRPLLVVPECLLTELKSAELEAIVVHELLHIRRRDLWIQAIATVATALHWFNPLVWMALADLRHQRECACDEWTLKSLPELD